MPMKLVQFQSKLSEPKIFQQFGIKTAFTAISDSVPRTQNFSCSCGGEIMPSFALDIFQCRSWRNFIVLILGVLFKSLKLSLRIGLAMAGYSSLVLKRQLNQLFLSMAFDMQIHAYHGCERQAFFCSTQAEDIYSDGELRSRARDRGAENKMCFKTITALSDQGYSLHVTWTPVLFIVEESINNLKSGCLTFSDDLVGSDAMYQCRVVNIDKRQLKYLVYFVSIKIIVGNCQNHYRSHLTCLRFQQYVLRYLAFLPNVYVGASITRNFARARFLVEDLIISSRNDARLCSNEEFN
jgi:hypothetical protein